MFKQYFYNMCLYSLFFITPLVTTTNTPDFFDNNVENSEENNDLHQIDSLQNIQSKVLEKQLLELKKQAQKVAYCAQQVEQVLGAKILKITKAERTKIAEGLQIIKHVLQSLQDEALQVAHPQVIGQGSYYIAYIALYLKKGLQNITSISAQDFMETMQENSKKIEHIDLNGSEGLKNIEKRIINNRKSIRRLIIQAENLGLTPFNQSWRAFEKSKFKARALLAAKYATLGLICYTAAILLLHPDTKLPFFYKQIKDLPRPFGVGKTSHPIYQEQINNDLAQRATRYHEAVTRKQQTFTEILGLENQLQQLGDNPNNSFLVSSLNNSLSILRRAYCFESEAAHELLKSMHNPQEISFADGLTIGAKNIVSIPGVLLALCSPLTVYAKKLWGHAFGTLSTTQDCDQAEKWVVKKINHTLAYLRGDITYEEHKEKEQAASTSEQSEEQVTLDDIIGQEYLKEIALELADFIKNPTKYEQAHIKAEAGILLYGPPQTGKTMFAKALKTLLEKEVPGRIAFIPVTSHDLEQFSIDEMFYLAGKSAPCVLFIDEIEMLGAKRSGPSGQTTRSLLTNLNGLSSQNISKNVFVIGATNQPQDLDYALLVKGRFGTVIPLTYPPYKNRVEYIKRQLETRGVRHLPENLITQIAEETEGHSYNDLLSIVDDAVRRSMRELRTVTKNDFDLAFDKQIRNILPLGNLTKSEETIISTYQVGVGLMRHILNTQDQVTCLTTHPVKDKIKYNEASFSFKETEQNSNENQKLLPSKSLNLTINGYTFTTKPANNSTFVSDEEVKHEILVLLAGQAALKLLTGKTFSNYMPEHNAECLHKIKLSLSNGEASTEDIIKEALSLKTKYEAEALQLLAPYKEAIEKLAAQLADRTIIRSEEWQQLLAEIIS